MKNILRITLITIIIAVAIIIVRYYIVDAYTDNREKIVYEKDINSATNRGEETTREINQEMDIDSIVVKDEKYTTDYEANGEIFKILGTLKIPKINIEYDILGEGSADLMEVSLVHYWGTKPNRVGNMCVIGHNYLDSRFFGRLHTLTNGDYIEITDEYGYTLKYYVYDKFVVSPNDTSCTSQLTKGEKEITLITCYKEGTNRLVVKARAEKEESNVIKELIDIIK